MHIFLCGILFNFSPLFLLVEFYFTRITLSLPLIKYFCLLILIVHSIIPYWLWEASHLHAYYIRESPLLISDHTLYAIVMLQVWRAIFWRRSLNAQACCGELLSSSLLLSCIHGFHHHVPSMHFHISLDLIFAFID